MVGFPRAEPFVVLSNDPTAVPEKDVSVNINIIQNTDCVKTGTW